MSEPTCSECWLPGDLVEDLCHRCRCYSCGAVDAPRERYAVRLCVHCAIDAGCIRSLGVEMESP